MKREHIAIVSNAMVGVNKEGTGARAFAGAPYTHAGKTGTAQVISLKGEKYVESRVPSASATTRSSSPTRPRTSRRSRSP